MKRYKHVTKHRCHAYVRMYISVHIYISRCRYVHSIHISLYHTYYICVYINKYFESLLHTMVCIVCILISSFMTNPTSWITDGYLSVHTSWKLQLFSWTEQTCNFASCKINCETGNEIVLLQLCTYMCTYVQNYCIHIFPGSFIFMYMNMYLEMNEMIHIYPYCIIIAITLTV